MNYVIFRRFLTSREYQFLIVNTFTQSQQENIGLIDGEKANLWYNSKRMFGLSYIYSTAISSLFIMNQIKRELTKLTGINFDDELSSKVVTLCKYEYEGGSNTHRDRTKVGEIVSYQEYSGIILLTKPELSQDEFYINFNTIERATSVVSNEGRDVYEKNKLRDRFYPNLEQGDVIIFKNNISAHGVDKVTSTNCRITTGFRSK